MLVGLIAFDRLPVRLVPDVDTPIVTVATFYPGANAEVVESQITTPIEDVLSGIEGIDYIQSVSRSEESQVSIRFRLDRDPDGAASDVRDRVAQARGILPEEARDPIVQKQEADAQAIIYLGFSSDRHDDLEIADIAERLIKDRVQSIKGVAEAQVYGNSYAMRVWLDTQRLAAFGLTPADVEDALRRQNVEVPAGRVESYEREFTVVSQTDLRLPAQFEAIILREDSGYLVRLGDVARVELGADNSRFRARYNGNKAVPLGIVKQATANPLQISADLKAMMPELIATLPEGMSGEINYDSTIFIEESIKSVYTTIAEAIALVTIVIFLFLRSIRATLIPLVTIPVSLIGAFAIMLALGFTINTLTLLAMVLAIGLVVDDAIVMLENIYRHIENGMSPLEAAFKGSREIAFAVVAMTLTLAAVYLPIGVFDRPQRQAVHRIRTHTCRRGTRVGIRRADAVADDVLEAAAPSQRARPLLSGGRARTHPADVGLPARDQHRAEQAVHRCRRRCRGHRVTRRIADAAAVRTRSGGGSGLPSSLSALHRKARRSTTRTVMPVSSKPSSRTRPASNSLSMSSATRR